MHPVVVIMKVNQPIHLNSSICYTFDSIRFDSIFDLIWFVLIWFLILFWFYFIFDLISTLLSTCRFITQHLLFHWLPVSCNHTSLMNKGKLIDGTIFDSSYERGSPTSFAPNQVIKGWTEAMQLMVVGDKVRITYHHYCIESISVYPFCFKKIHGFFVWHNRLYINMSTMIHIIDLWIATTL